MAAEVSLPICRMLPLANKSLMPSHLFKSDQIKILLHTLQKNKAIWYAYDIDESGKRSVFAPFFGIPTASLT
ncbi:MAG: hypothetical protein K2X53_00020, partial [Alphaproteobacteria bacterium]|nr:hypothetical protein [Alphaproteobacteria bacterium]